MSEREPSATSNRRDEGRFPLRAILVGVLLLYALIFVVLNLERVQVNFVFFSTRISLVVAILLLLGIGFAAGYLTRGLRLRQRAERL